MNYHMIRTDDMLNGDGLRVIIFLSGCRHRCEGCHNPETWDINSGKHFNEEAIKSILEELNKDYISGVTISGGDPLIHENLQDVYNLVKIIKEKYPNKTIWLYTGYSWNYINSIIRGIDKKNNNINKTNNLRRNIIKMCDVICDGKFIQSLADVNCPWVGSTNQRVIDVKKTMKKGEIVLWKE